MPFSTRSTLGWAMVVLALGAGGCGILGGDTDGGTGGEAMDLTAPAGDLTSAAPEDMTMLPPDLNVSVSSGWQLKTAYIQGGNNNNFGIDCDDPTVKATQILFTVTNGAGKSATSMTPCPAMARSGELLLSLPDATGPYTVGAVLVGKPMSNSTKVKNVMPNTHINVEIYAGGCDQPQCM